jgi:hypothetical protein
MKKLFGMVILLVSVGASFVNAMQPPPPGMVDAPPPPPPMQSGEPMAGPDVTIIQTENERIYEYRVGATLYMVRIVPRVGPPYYYFDSNGDGELDYHQTDPRQSNVNMWEIFRW